MAISDPAASAGSGLYNVQHSGNGVPLANAHICSKYISYKYGNSGEKKEKLMDYAILSTY
jgi:hypothetical protein